MDFLKDIKFPSIDDVKFVAWQKEFKVFLDVVAIDFDGKQAFCKTKKDFKMPSAGVDEKFLTQWWMFDSLIILPVSGFVASSGEPLIAGHIIEYKDHNIYSYGVVCFNGLTKEYEYAWCFGSDGEMNTSFITDGIFDEAVINILGHIYLDIDLCKQLHAFCKNTLGEEKFDPNYKVRLIERDIEELLEELEALRKKKADLENSNI